MPKSDHHVVGAARPLPQGAGGSAVDPSEQPGVIDSAWFISRNLSRTGPMGYCLSFFYIMEGLSADRIIIHLKDMITAENASLWELRESVDGSWTKGELAYTYDGAHLVRWFLQFLFIVYICNLQQLNMLDYKLLFNLLSLYLFKGLFKSGELSGKILNKKSNIYLPV